MDDAIRALNRLRLVGVLEGLSFLVLLGVAMPLKYLAGQPQAVQVVGWVHGGLFVAFVATLLHAAQLRRWPVGRTAAAFVSALLPFGTFFLDKQLRAEAAGLSGGAPPVPAA